MKNSNIFLFIRLQWLEKKRAPYFQSKIIFTVLGLILGLYLIASFAFLGWHLDELILKNAANSNPMDVVLKAMFYYFIFDLFLRFNMQSLPVLDIQPLLVLPIKKSKVYHYILTKSLLSFFNIMPLAIFIPFLIKQDLSRTLNSSIYFFILIIILFVLINNYLNFYLKKYFNKKPSMILSILIAMLVLVYIDLTGIYEFSLIFSQIVELFTENPLLLLLPLLALIYFYHSNLTLLKTSSHIDLNLDKIKKKTFIFKNMDFLNIKNQIANLILLELKLLFRNKRPKTFVYITLIYVLYLSGSLIGASDNGNDFILIIITTLITSSFATFHGQFLFAWESSYFDFILSQNIKLKKFIIAKDYLLSGSIILIYLLVFPFVLIYSNYFYLFTALFIYNLGTMSFQIIFFAMMNKNPVDLTRSAMFNYEGSSLGNFLMVLPILILPLIIYFLFNLLEIKNLPHVAFTLIGLCSILYRNKVYNILIKRFNKKKHTLAEGYRK